MDAGHRRRVSSLSASERTLVAVQGLASLASAAAGIFLNLYIFNQAGFEAVTMFSLVTYVLLYALYVVSGYLLRRLTASSLIQAGLVLQGALYLAVFALGDQATRWLVALAVVGGVGQGLYWSGINVAMYVETRSATRTVFFAWLSPVTRGTSALGPVIGGAVIALAASRGGIQVGYGAVFIGLTVANLAAAVLTRRLAAHTGIRFSIRDVLHRGRGTAWVAVLIQQVVKGLWDTAFPTVWVLLMFVAVGNVSVVSFIAAGAAVVYAVVSVAAGRMLSRRPGSTAIATLLLPLGMVLFGVGGGWVEVVAFVLLVRGVAPFQDIPVQRIIFDTMDDLPGSWRGKYHQLVERELALGGARVLSFAAMTAAFAHGNDPATARVAVVALAACPLLVGLLQDRLDRMRRVSGATQSGVRAPAGG